MERCDWNVRSHNTCPVRSSFSRRQGDGKFSVSSREWVMPTETSDQCDFPESALSIFCPHLTIHGVEDAFRANHMEAAVYSTPDLPKDDGRGQARKQEYHIIRLSHAIHHGGCIHLAPRLTRIVDGCAAIDSRQLRFGRVPTTHSWTPRMRQNMLESKLIQCVWLDTTRYRACNAGNRHS